MCAVESIAYFQAVYEFLLIIYDRVARILKLKIEY